MKTLAELLSAARSNLAAAETAIGELQKAEPQSVELEKICAELDKRDTELILIRRSLVKTLMCCSVMVREYKYHLGTERHHGHYLLNRKILEGGDTLEWVSASSRGVKSRQLKLTTNEFIDELIRNNTLDKFIEQVMNVIENASIDLTEESAKGAARSDKLSALIAMLSGK